MARSTRKHSENFYLNARERIYDRLSQLPKGTVKERLISGRRYYYFQRREGKKVIHTYIGKEIPEDLKKKLEEREALRRDLDNVQEALRGFVAAKIKKVF